MAWRTCSSTAAIAERRRRQRRTLHAAVDVTVSCRNGGAVTGLLLNLSTDGAAVRLRQGLFSSERPERVRVRFTAHPASGMLDLTARIVSVTPAQSRGFAVVGMEFDRSATSEEDRAALRAILAAAELDHWGEKAE